MTVATVTTATKHEIHGAHLEKFVLIGNSCAFIAHLPDDAAAKAPASIASAEALAAVSQAVELDGSSVGGFPPRVVEPRGD